jgi:hypothetical protein
MPGSPIGGRCSHRPAGYAGRGKDIAVLLTSIVSATARTASAIEFSGTQENISVPLRCTALVMGMRERGTSASSPSTKLETADRSEKGYVRTLLPALPVRAEPSKGTRILVYIKQPPEANIPELGRRNSGAVANHLLRVPNLTKVLYGS